MFCVCVCVCFVGYLPPFHGHRCLNDLNINAEYQSPHETIHTEFDPEADMFGEGPVVEEYQEDDFATRRGRYSIMNTAI